MLGSIDPNLPAAVMIVPHRHVETPFELHDIEWSDIGFMLNLARLQLAEHEPDGFTIGWNVGAVAGQHVFHTHLHVIARFRTDTLAGKGLAYDLRQPPESK